MFIDFLIGNTDHLTGKPFTFYIARVVNIKIAKDRITNIPWGKVSIFSHIGFGYVEFSTHEEARAFFHSFNDTVLPGTGK